MVQQSLGTQVSVPSKKDCVCRAGEGVRRFGRIIRLRFLLVWLVTEHLYLCNPTRNMIMRAHCESLADSRRDRYQRSEGGRFNGRLWPCLAFVRRVLTLLPKKKKK